MPNGELMDQRARVLRWVLALSIIALVVVGVVAFARDGDESIDASDPPASRPGDALITDGVADGSLASEDPLEEQAADGSTASTPARPVVAPGDPGSAPAGSSSASVVEQGRLPVGPGVHGVTDTSIEIGLITTDAKAVDAVGAAVGATGDGEGAGNYDKANAAAVDLVNAMGGIAGRKVEPVYYFANPADITTRSGRQRQNQAMCAHWTEDNDVFAMWGGTSTEESMFECATSTQTPMMLTRYGIQPSQRRLESLAGYWYTTSFFTAERRERALANFLLAEGFFGEDAKVGLLVEDKPDTRDGINQGMKPALAAAGIEPIVEIAYPDPIDSPWPNYVLQLQSAGVTHVLMSHPTIGTIESLFMMRAAEDQRYRPKWGLASDHNPASLPGIGAPPDQLEGVLAMGSKPAVDVGDVTPQSETSRLCIEQMKKAAPGEEDNAYAWEVCDFLFFLRAAFQRADVVSPAGLAEGVARLGTSYPSTMNIGGATQFGPGRPDGVVVARAVRYDRATNTMKYTTPPQPLPD